MASLKRTKPIDAVIIHHTVVPAQDWSQERTSKALRASSLAYDGKSPYHRIIGNSWHYQGRPDDTIGYQAGNWDMNTRSVGIALTGNFNENKPTAYQKKQLASQIKELMERYNIPRSRVFLHKEVRDKGTACPGNFITHAFIDTLLEDMSCEKYKALDKERVAQIKRLQKESRDLTTEVHEANGKVKDRESTIKQQEKIAEELRKEIIRKEEVIIEKDNALSNAIKDAEETVEENLKQRLATRVWNWLFKE